MSSTQQGSNTNGVRGSKTSKGEKATRRSWSPREESSLLASLKDLVANGWKSDNGFRGGYLSRLEIALAKEFPGTNIKGVPHITSKLQLWKKNYYSLSLMLSRSGVGWNADGKHTIDCTDELWEQIKKCDKNAEPMRHRSWPMFEDWQIIFGKDRATGDHAEDMMDAVNNMVHEDSGKGFDENEVCMEDISVNDVGDQSSSHCEQEKVVHKNTEKVVKKRKTTVDTLQKAIEIFGEISQGTNARLEMVANRIGYEYDIDQAKKDAYGLVENIPGLTEKNKFQLCDIFTDQVNRLITFQGLPAEKREAYVHHLLKMNK